MNAYIYQAALLCPDCAELTRREIEIGPAFHAEWAFSNTDKWPAGPYSDGGGEADCPQHCDRCRVFLENPLTPEGYRSVESCIAEFNHTGRGHLPTLQEWAEFYEVTEVRP